MYIYIYVCVGSGMGTSCSVNTWFGMMIILSISPMTLGCLLTAIGQPLAAIDQPLTHEANRDYETIRVGFTCLHGYLGPGVR